MFICRPLLLSLRHWTLQQFIALFLLLEAINRKMSGFDQSSFRFRFAIILVSMDLCLFRGSVLSNLESFWITISVGVCCILVYFNLVWMLCKNLYNFWPPTKCEICGFRLCLFVDSFIQKRSKIIKNNEWEDTIRIIFRWNCFIREWLRWENVFIFEP